MKRPRSRRLAGVAASGFVMFALMGAMTPAEGPGWTDAAPMVVPPVSVAPVGAESLSGVATWYRWHAGEAAAGPLLRQALGSKWRGQTVAVCADACVSVRLTDWCLCSHGRRLVDLDSRSFAKLAPLSAGVVAVTIEVGGVPVQPTAPPTDAEGQ